MVDRQVRDRHILDPGAANRGKPEVTAETLNDPSGVSLTQSIAIRDCPSKTST